MGVGTQFEALFGHASVMGYPDMGLDGSPGGVASDACTGVTIAIAATMALHQREKTGKGMFIDISMGENFLPHLGELVMDYTINGRVAGPMGNRDHLGHLVQGVYPCAGDDEWIAISMGNIEQWQALCKTMGSPKWAEDGKYDSLEGRQRHREELDQQLGECTVDYTPHQVMRMLQRAGVPAGVVQTGEHLYHDPHLRSRGFLISVEHPGWGYLEHPGLTAILSETPGRVSKGMPVMGEHNGYILSDLLGLTTKRFQELVDQKVIS